MVDLYRDFVYARVTAAVLVADTTIVVDDPSKFPSNAILAKSDFFVSFESSLGTTATFEVVKVLSITGSTLTVQRGILPGYPAVAHTAFTYIKASITSDMMRRMRGGFIGTTVPAPDLDIYTPGDPFLHTGEGRYYGFTQSAAQLRDTFTRANSATTLGATEVGATSSQIYASPWYNAIGVMGITSNQAYVVSLGAGNETIALTNVGCMDFDYSLDVTLAEAAYLTAGGATATADLVFRMSADGQNGYVVVWTSTTTFALYRKVGGVYTLITSATINVTAGTTHTIRVNCLGNLMTLYTDGVQRFSYTEVTAGFTTATSYSTIGANVGARASGANAVASTVLRFDNLVVNTAAGGGGGGWQPTADITGQSLGILTNVESQIGQLVNTVDDLLVASVLDDAAGISTEATVVTLSSQVDDVLASLVNDETALGILTSTTHALVNQADDLLGAVQSLPVPISGVGPPVGLASTANLIYLDTNAEVVYVSNASLVWTPWTFPGNLNAVGTPGISGTSTSAYVSGAAQTSAVVPLPTGARLGDYCLIFCEIGAQQANNFVTAPGWTQVYTLDASQLDVTILGKYLTPSDLATGSIIVSWPGATSWYIQARSYSYLAFDAIVATTTNLGSGNYSGNFAGPQVTTTAANDRVINAVFAPTATLTFTPNPQSNIVTVGTGNGGTVIAEDEIQAAAGASVARSVYCNFPYGARQIVQVALALKPATQQVWEPAAYVGTGAPVPGTNVPLQGFDGMLYINRTAGTLYGYLTGIWTLLSGGGGSSINVVAKTATYTAANGDVVLCDATTAAFAVNLPTPTVNRQIVVKKTDASTNSITVTASSGTIDGAATFLLANRYDAVTVVADGTNWSVI